MSFVETSVVYAGGSCKVRVAEAGALTLEADGVTAVRAAPPLVDWFSRHWQGGRGLVDLEIGKPASDALAAALARVISCICPEAGTDWEVSSVITRSSKRGATSSPYACTVHRDLDEVAAGNLRGAGFVRFFNCWVPLKPVTSHPLGFVLPRTVTERDITCFSPALPHDRTGMSFSPGHEWVWFPSLEPGDVLLWDSTLVFHASFPLPAPAQQERVSADMRVYFRGPPPT